MHRLASIRPEAMLALARPLLCLLLVAVALAAPAPAPAAALASGAAASPPTLVKAFGTAETPQRLTVGSEFASARGLLFFTVGSDDDPLTIPPQTELWRSDGIAAGTIRLLSLPASPPGQPQGTIGDLVPVGDTLFFTAPRRGHRGRPCGRATAPSPAPSPSQACQGASST